MRITAFSLIFMFPLALFAQGSFISGSVALFNSQFETGKRQYVANAQVEEDFGKSQPTTTGADGLFRLPLIGIKDLEKVYYSVKKTDFEVVNIDALQAVAGQAEPQRVFMAPLGKIAENKLKYYQINRVASEKALNEKLQRLEKEILEVQNDKAKLTRLEGEHAQLRAQFEHIEASARELAERYARTNLDDASADYQRAFRCFQQGQLDSALMIFKGINLEATASDIISEQYRNAEVMAEYARRDSEKNKRKAETLQSLQFKAQLHQIKFEPDNAEATFELMMRLDTLNITTQTQFAYFLTQQTKYEKAIELIKKALKITSNEVLKGSLLNGLGNIYHLNKNTDLSRNNYEAALAIQRSLVQRDTEVYAIEYAMTLSNLGNLYLTTNDFQQALQYYGEAIELVYPKEKDLPTHQQRNLGQMLGNIGLLFFQMGDFENAEQAYLASLEITRALTEINPMLFQAESARVLDGLGSVYTKMNDLGQANAALEEALQILTYLAKKNPNAYRAKLARIQENMGLLKMKMGDLGAARRLYDQAVSIRLGLLRSNTALYETELTGTLINLGDFLIKIGDYNKADTLLGAALEVFSRLAIDKPAEFLPQVAALQNNYGNLYYVQHNLVMAEKAYSSAADIYVRLAETQPDVYEPDVAMTHDNLGNVYAEQGDYLMAVPSYEAAIEIRRKYAKISPAVHEPDLAVTLGNYGVYLFEQNDPKRAVSMLTEAVAIRNRLSQDDHDDHAVQLAVLLNNLGAIYASLGAWDDAETSIKSCLKIRINLANAYPSVYEPALASGFRNLGRCYHMQKDHEKAAVALNEALDIWSKLVEEDPQRFEIEFQMEVNNLQNLYNDWIADIPKDSNKVPIQQKVVQLQIRLAKDYPHEPSVQFGYAQAYGNLAWYQLAAGQFMEAEISAKEGLSFNPSQLWIKPNLAHALLFQGKFKEAKELYLSLKNEADAEGKSFGQICMEDLNILEQTGISHPDVTKIRQLLKSK